MALEPDVDKRFHGNILGENNEDDECNDFGSQVLKTQTK